MPRFLTAALLLAGAACTALAATTTGASNVTFNKDVLPILQKNCQTCHRPGEIGPMAFLNYEGTRPWAKAIKQAVLTKQMPPWFADPRYGHFANERKLSDADIKTVATWVDSGAPEGTAKAGTSNPTSRTNCPSPTPSPKTAPSSTHTS
jgi:mono/diheme cytochrome c family protein